MNPKITVICLTYRRPELLEEAIQSFLMQDYAGEKELIIVNDEPEQELVFDHPQVKIHNCDVRAPALNVKHNYAVSMATGNLITIADDDDIYLPHRLTTIASQQSGGIWFSDRCFAEPGEDSDLVLVDGHIHCNIAYTKDQFIKHGAYHNAKEVAFDVALIQSMRQDVTSINEGGVTPSYIARRRKDLSNHSSRSFVDYDLQYERHRENNSDFVKGRIVLNPQWRSNWTLKCVGAMELKPVPLHEIDDRYHPLSVVEIKKQVKL